MIDSRLSAAPRKVSRLHRRFFLAATKMEIFEPRVLLSAITSYTGGGYTPTGIAADNAGNEWVADGSGIYKIDSTGTQVGGPFATDNRPYKIAFDPLNNDLYFSDPTSAQVVQVGLDGQVVQTFNMPDSDTQSPQYLTVAGDGSVWFTTSGSSNADGTLNNAQIGRIDLAGNLTFATVPDANTAPLQIASAPDGSVWFTTAGVSVFSDGVSTMLGKAEIGHAHANTDGSIAIDPMFSINEPASFPGGLTVAGDGSLWFSMGSDHGQDTGQVDGPDRIVHAVLSGGNLLQTEYVLPGASTASTVFPGAVGLDNAGRLWFTEASPARLSYLDIGTGQFTEMAVPNDAGSPSSLVVTPTDVWATAIGGTNNLLRVNLASFASPLTATAPNIVATQGVEYTGTLATLTTADAGPYSYAIDYGDGQTASGTITPDGSGTYAIPADVTYADVGNYATTVIISTASGDQISVRGMATVSPAVVNNLTSTSITSSANPAVFGQQIIFTAGVVNTDGSGPVPTGSVQFSVDGTAVGAPVSLDATGHASLAGSFTSGASHTIAAVYNPASNFVGSSASMTQALQAIGLETDPINSALTDLFIGSSGALTGDSVQVNAAGSSNTGSTGVTVIATLNGVKSQTTYSQALGVIYIYLQNGNNNIQLAPSLTLNAVISAGNGGNNIHLGNGNYVMMLGNGNDNVQAGNGTQIVMAGNGNDNVQLGNGSNDIVILGSGNDNVQIGSGNDEVVQVGNGNDNIHIGNGSFDVVTLGAAGDNVQIGTGSNNTVILPVGLFDHNIKFGAGSNNIIT